MALIAGTPVSNVVLVVVAERGPLADAARAGRHGFFFMLGPVPANPQNRDAVMAPAAGHGYYGAKSSEGSDETWTFHSGDTKTLERIVPNFDSGGAAIRTALASGSMDPLKAAARKEKRLVSLPRRCPRGWAGRTRCPRWGS